MVARPWPRPWRRALVRNSIALAGVVLLTCAAVLLFPAAGRQAQQTVPVASSTPVAPGVRVVSGAEAWGPAPTFMLSALDGRRLGPRDWRGHPLLLAFGGSWCIPCRQEAPTLVRLAARYASAGLGVLGVDEGDSAAAARRFARQYAVPFPIVLDEGKRVATWYGVVGLPTLALIGGDGRLISIHVGPLPDEGVAAFLAPVLRR